MPVTFPADRHRNRGVRKRQRRVTRQHDKRRCYSIRERTQKVYITEILHYLWDHRHLCSSVVSNLPGMKVLLSRLTSDTFSLNDSECSNATETVLKGLDRIIRQRRLPPAPWSSHHRVLSHDSASLAREYSNASRTPQKQSILMSLAFKSRMYAARVMARLATSSELPAPDLPADALQVLRVIKSHPLLTTCSTTSLRNNRSWHIVLQKDLLQTFVLRPISPISVLLLLHMMSFMERQQSSSSVLMAVPKHFPFMTLTSDVLYQDLSKAVTFSTSNLSCLICASRLLTTHSKSLHMKNHMDINHRLNSVKQGLGRIRYPTLEWFPIVGKTLDTSNIVSTMEKLMPDLISVESSKVAKFGPNSLGLPQSYILHLYSILHKAHLTCDDAFYAFCHETSNDDDSSLSPRFPAISTPLPTTSHQCPENLVTSTLFTRKYIGNKALPTYSKHLPLDFKGIQFGCRLCRGTFDVNFDDTCGAYIASSCLLVADQDTLDGQVCIIDVKKTTTHESSSNSRVSLLPWAPRDVSLKSDFDVEEEKVFTSDLLLAHRACCFFATPQLHPPLCRPLYTSSPAHTVSSFTWNTGRSTIKRFM